MDEKIFIAIIGAILSLVCVIFGVLLSFLLQWKFQYKKNIKHFCNIFITQINGKTIDGISITVVNKGLIPITIKSMGLIAPDKNMYQVISNLFGEPLFYNNKLKYYIRDSEGRYYTRKLKNKFINYILDLK